MCVCVCVFYMLCVYESLGCNSWKVIVLRGMNSNRVLRECVKLHACESP